MLACFSLHVPSFRSLASTSLVWTLDLLDFQAAFKAIGTKPLPAIWLTIAHTACGVFTEGCRRQPPLAALEVCVKQVVWRPDSVGMIPVLRHTAHAVRAPRRSCPNYFTYYIFYILHYILYIIYLYSILNILYSIFYII